MTKVREIRDLVGIPKLNRDYYRSRTLPECSIYTETKNFILFQWRRRYVDPAGDCAYIWLYVVHKPTCKWCKVIELDQTHKRSRWDVCSLKDRGKSLQFELSAYCKSIHGETTCYHRLVFMARALASKSNLIVYEIENKDLLKERWISYRNIITQIRFQAEDEVVKALNGANVSEEAKEAFIQFVLRVDAELERVRAILKKRWEKRPLIFTSDGYLIYKEPLIWQFEIDIINGVSAFTIEEQIGHRAEGDPLMRNELFVMKTCDTEARCVYEDRAYKSDRPCLLHIKSLTVDYIEVINYGLDTTFEVAL